MAKVTITLEDAGDDVVDMHIESDPPVAPGSDPSKQTLAQQLGAFAWHTTNAAFDPSYDDPALHAPTDDDSKSE